MQPYGPVAGGGDLVALEVEEFVGRHVVGEDVRALGLEHRGEDDAVEDDVVLADEVDHAGVRVFPVLFPVGCELACGGNVADGGVEPYVEHLAFGAFDGHGHAPVEVAADGPRLQALVEPRLALSVDVGFPLLVILEDPLAQERLVAVEGQVPVFGLAEDGLAAGDGGAGVDQLGGAEGGAALLTLVAVSSFIPAVGTGAGDIAVGQELSCFLVVELLVGFLDEDPFVI